MKSVLENMPVLPQTIGINETLKCDQCGLIKQSNSPCQDGWLTSTEPPSKRLYDPSSTKEKTARVEENRKRKILGQALIPTPTAEYVYEACVTRCDHWKNAIDLRIKTQSLANSNLDEAQYALEWSNLELTDRAWKATRSVTLDIEEVVNEGLNLILHGAVGAGKTQAGVLICRSVNDLGKTSLKIRWKEFLETISASWGRKDVPQEAELIRAAIAPDVLLIDDLGAGQSHSDSDKAVAFSVKYLERIIGDRYDAMKPTIITTNLEPGDFSKHFGHRVHSRLTGRCIFVEFTKSYRRDSERKSVSELASRIWSRANNGSDAFQL